MAKDSDRLRGSFQAEESGGLSGLLAEEDEFDRRTLWRLGTWAAVSVGTVILALVANQSSIGLRREQSASADLIRQAQQIQLAARESQNETRRLTSAVDTLNSDRDRLYSRVAVLEQGLDSVTGAIARQAPASPSPQASAAPISTSQQASASAAMPASTTASSPPAAPSAAPASTASTPPAVTASADPPPAAAKPAPAAPVVAPVAATTPADKQDKVADKPDKAADKKDRVADKKDKQAAQASTAASSEPGPAPVEKSVAARPPAPAQPSGTLMASKSMMAPPDPAAGKLIEPATPPKTVTSAPLPEIAAVAPKASEETESEPALAVPAPTVQRTEFGVDVGGANSVPGLRALWRGLLKSRSNTALTKLRPIIVIKENNNGLGMQLRLVAGPISDAAAAAKICASLAVNGRGCSTTVFEGQRLVVNADEQAKADAKMISEAKPAPDAKPEAAPKLSFHRRYVPKHPPKVEDPPPKPEPSTLSLIFGKR
jgi:hypothetical protein